jgi:uncharacterized protein (DUF1015 family)
MAKIIPFRAVRPPRSLAHLVASRAYANYSRRDLAQKLESNPYSFLHIINPDFNDPARGRRKVTDRFKLVGQAYQAFKANKWLDRDEDTAYYIYRQTTGAISFTGIIAGASVQDYQDEVILKHESTLIEREKLFKEYLEITEFNAEPVLLTCPDDPQLEETVVQTCSACPEYEFYTSDGILHEMWMVNDPLVIAKITDRFSQFHRIYIADGHHRSASSALLAHDHPGEAYQYFLAFFIPESQLRILPFHRLIDGEGLPEDDTILASLHQRFTVTRVQKAFIPQERGTFCLMLSGQVYRLEPTFPVQGSSPVQMLDAWLATAHILAPAFGIEDLRTDVRVSFIGGAVTADQVTERMRKEEKRAAILLHPVDMEQLKAVADAGEVMPPKSTFIEPKLRSGLTIYQFNDRID